MTTTQLFSIQHIERRAEDVFIYILNPLQPGTFTYKAGQFLTVLLHIHGREVRRSYSLCTVSGVDPFPAIAVKRVVNGEASRYIQDRWKEGDVISTLPPAGFFTLDETGDSRDVFLIAAGSGITPIYSLLRYSLQYQPQNKVTLLYSNRNPESTLFLNELNALQQRHSFHTEYFFSESQYLDKARLTKERLEHAVKDRLSYKKEAAVFFLCGPYDFMLMCAITLKSMGFSANAIRREIFITNDLLPAASLLKEIPPKSVTLILDGIRYDITVPYMKSVLDVAIEEHIPVPYSCKAGKCGTCAGYCESGRVFMTYNEVLTDGDEASGRVLTCTAHPLDDQVVISF